MSPPRIAGLVPINYYGVCWLLLDVHDIRRPPQVRHLSFRLSLPHLHTTSFAPTGFVMMCSLTRSGMPLYVVHVLQYRLLQSCFLQFKDHSLQPCSLLCAFRIRTSGTCTLGIIKLFSRLENSCAMLGTHNVHNQWRGSVKICSFSFQTTFGVVGRWRVGRAKHSLRSFFSAPIPATAETPTL